MNLTRLTQDGLDAREAVLRQDARECTDELYRENTPELDKPGLREELDLIFSELAAIRAERQRRIAVQRAGFEQLSLDDVDASA